MNGKILNGYDLAGDLKDIKIPDKILFYHYEDGQIVKRVDLEETGISCSFADIHELYQATLECIISHKYGPKDWR